MKTLITGFLTESTVMMNMQLHIQMQASKLAQTCK